MKIQLLIKTKMLKNIDLFAFKLSDSVFIMLINFKMPTIVGYLQYLGNQEEVIRHRRSKVKVNLPVHHLHSTLLS